MARKIIVIQCSGAPTEIGWQCCHVRTGTREKAALCRNVDLVCQRVTEQTGLARADVTMEIVQLFVKPVALDRPSFQELPPNVPPL